MDLNDAIYQLSTDGRQIIIARTTMWVKAIDVKTGEILWKFNTAWKPIQEPAKTTNENVFFADKDAIWALNQMSGEVLWTRPVRTSAVDVLEVSENEVLVKYDQNLNVYNATTGEMRWSESACRNDFQPYLANAQVIFACDGINAFDLQTGEEIWVTQSDHRITNTTFDDGIIYYSLEDSIVAFDIEKQEELWKRPYDDGVFQYKIFGDNLAVVGRNHFCFLERKTGEKKWCADVNEAKNPVVIKDTIYLLNNTHNKIIAFDISTGERIGDVEISKIVRWTTDGIWMVTVDDAIVFGSDQQIFIFHE